MNKKIEIIFCIFFTISIVLNTINLFKTKDLQDEIKISKKHLWKANTAIKDMDKLFERLVESTIDGIEINIRCDRYSINGEAFIVFHWKNNYSDNIGFSESQLQYLREHADYKYQSAALNLLTEIYNWKKGEKK